MNIATITRDELIDQLDQVVLIEALPEMHYAADHLPGALNSPGPITPEVARSLAPDVSSKIVVYCSGIGCTRSRAAAIALWKLGYPNVSVYEGGKADWTDAGLPLESSRQLDLRVDSKV